MPLTQRIRRAVGSVYTRTWQHPSDPTILIVDTVEQTTTGPVTKATRNIRIDQHR